MIVALTCNAITLWEGTTSNNISRLIINELRNYINVMNMKELFKKNKLKELRLTRKLLQKDVAKLLGLTSQDRISHWETGVAVPSLVNTLKLAKLFSVTVEELY